MKVAVIGSRGLHVDVAPYMPGGVTSLISGGARGIDAMAERYAKERGLSLRVIRPDYAKHGKKAPLLRNCAIVEGADLVIAIWDGQSRGTRQAIRYAEKLGKPLRLHILPGPPSPLEMLAQQKGG